MEPYEDLYQQIDSYSDLVSGWRGDDSEPPTKATMDRAKELLWELLGEAVSLPRSVAPAGSGEIVFEWGDNLTVWAEESIFTILFGDHEVEFKRADTTAMLCYALLKEHEA